MIFFEWYFFKWPWGHFRMYTRIILKIQLCLLIHQNFSLMQSVVECGSKFQSHNFKKTEWIFEFISSDYRKNIHFLTLLHGFFEIKKVFLPCNIYIFPLLLYSKKHIWKSHAFCGCLLRVWVRASSELAAFLWLL